MTILGFNVKIFHVGKTLIYITVATFLIVVFGGGAYFLGQNQKLISDKSKTETVPTTTLLISPTSLPTNIKSQDPVVIIQGETNLDPKDAQGLRERVVSPYVDYFKDAYKNDVLISLKIEANTNASVSAYPYKAEAITKNGISEGFLISNILGQIDWWYPECLGKCAFTDKFKTKYPEIIVKVQ